MAASDPTGPDRSFFDDTPNPTVEQPERSRRLPVSLRLLCLSSAEPDWTRLATRFELAGCPEPRFRWVSSSAEALLVLREEGYDCIVVCAGRSPGESLAPAEILRFAQAVRGAGCEDPILVAAEVCPDREWSEFCGLECDVLITSSRWESAALIPMIRRLVERGEMTRESRRLALADQRRLMRERDEAEHLLGQQRQILEALEALTGAPPAERIAAPPTADAHRDVAADADESSQAGRRLPAEVDEYYHELLRTYVIMGSGNLGGEIARLADLISAAGLRPREALQLHLERVEALVRGLGNRSARHVMARADLLALELMVYLGERTLPVRGERSQRPVRRVSGTGGIDLTDLPPC